MEFMKSTRKNKKYMVKVNGKLIHFGDTRYGHFKDSTGLNLYSYLDHGDTKRRLNYKKRHSKILLKNGEPAYKNKSSPAFYSYNYLW